FFFRKINFCLKVLIHTLSFFCHKLFRLLVRLFHDSIPFFDIASKKQIKKAKQKIDKPIFCSKNFLFLINRKNSPSLKMLCCEHRMWVPTCLKKSIWHKATTKIVF
ncbi:hypothetical protein, partial [Enterococcus faecalis]